MFNRELTKSILKTNTAKSRQTPCNSAWYVKKVMASSSHSLPVTIKDVPLSNINSGLVASVWHWICVCLIVAYSFSPSHSVYCAPEETQDHLICNVWCWPHQRRGLTMPSHKCVTLSSWRDGTFCFCLKQLQDPLCHHHAEISLIQGWKRRKYYIDKYSTWNWPQEQLLSEVSGSLSC